MLTSAFNVQFYHKVFHVNVYLCRSHTMYKPVRNFHLERDVLSRGSYGVCVAITACTWALRGIRGNFPLSTT